MSERVASPSAALAANPRAATAVATAAVVLIAAHLLLRFATGAPALAADAPLALALIFGGGPMVGGLIEKALRGQFDSDLLAGLSIVTATLVDEWLAGAIVVLMLSGGTALEAYAVRRASSALQALAKRMPATAH